MAIYSDIDLTFIPHPSAQDRVIGEGTLTFFNNSTTVTGINTQFQRYLLIDDNLYVSNAFVGKVKSIESDTTLTLYSPAAVSSSIAVFDEYQTIKLPSDSSAITHSSFTKDTTYNFDVFTSNQVATEGEILRFNILTNYPQFVLPEFRLSNLRDEYIPVKYKITGIDRYDVLGEYSRINKFQVEISDYLQGELAFYPYTNENYNGYYSAYVHIQTTPDQENEVMERATIQFDIADGTVLGSHNNTYTFSRPGDITIRTDENAIKTSIKHIVKTMQFEKPFDSNYGTDVMSLLFDNLSSPRKRIVERSIETAIADYEPRCILLGVTVVQDDNPNAVTIKIEFKIKESSQPVTFNLMLERTR